MIPRVTSLLRQRSTRRLPAFFASPSPSGSSLSTTTLAAPTQRPSALSSMRRSRFAFSIHHKAEVGLCSTAAVPGRAYATSSSNNGSDTEGPTCRGQGEDEPDGALHTTMPWVTAEEEEAAAAATAAIQSPLASSSAVASGPDIPDTDVQARASGTGDGCDSAAGFCEGGIDAAECSSHVVPQSIDTESVSLHDMAETLLGDDAGIDTSSSQRLHHPPSDPSTPATAAEESTTQALASDDPASMIPPSSEQLTSTPEGAKASAPLSPWDDNGVGLVRRRVAQWYVPGLEREHRQLHGPAGTRDAAAPTVKLSEVMSEVVSVALKGTGNPADHTGLQPRSKRDGAAASVPQDTKLEGIANTAEFSATASAMGEAGAAQTDLATAAVSADRGGAGVSSTPATATPLSSSSPSTASSSTAGASGKDSPSEAQQRSEKAGSTPQQAAAPVNAAEGDEEDADADQDEELPETLLTVQANRNKRLKRALIAGLGSDFAKAGLSNDGVRTSFSVVNYQTIKQLTGLHRIPSTLLMSCLVAPENEFSWIDISMHPTATLSEYKEALEEVLLGLGMHRTMVEDSAEPMLLPQVTVTKGCYSLLMRYAIEAPANKQMDSFQDLTNRFTVFLSQKRIITVHRTQCSYVEELKLNWLHYLSGGGAHDAAANAHRVASGFFTADGGDSHHFTPRGMQYLLYYFVKETIGTFTQAIAKCIVEFDRYEANLFSTQRNRSSMAREIYHIKRRASVYGRTLTLTQDAYAHIASALQISSSQVGYQEIMHDLAHVESLAEELNSNADSVLQLLFQLSSYQVNELMRVLTLFSAFFIPLSFIASVYGMNFENLPMLHSDYGGVFCAVLMLTVATGIFLWFRVNRFI